MTNLPPSWQSNQPPVAPPAAPETGSGNEPDQRMVRVRLPSRRPMVTYSIIGITIVVYLLQMATQAGFFQGPFIVLGQWLMGSQIFQQLINLGYGSDLLVLLGGKISPLIQLGEYWRLITPILLHASLIHIGFNMYALFALGPAVESYYGRWRFLALYLLCGLGGNVLSYQMSPGLISSIGASTSIFGLIAAWGIFLYQNRSLFGPRARSMLTNVVVIAVINLVIGFSPGIDNWGHLGGLIAGLAFGWFAGPRMEVAYNYPEYELNDQRSSTRVWLVSIVLFAILMGIAIGITILRNSQL
jgi:rhomboid protease GluP